jgi:peroxiredoxin
MLHPGAQVDDSAIGFHLADVDGGSESLADILAAGPVVIVFFKVSCPVCQLAMPFIERIAQGAGAGAPQMVAISQDDPQATRAFLNQFGAGVKTLLDPGKQRYPLSNAFRIEHVPTVFALSPNGIVEHAFTGFVKSELAALGERFGVETFRADENVPALKPG